MSERNHRHMSLLLHTPVTAPLSCSRRLASSASLEASSLCSFLSASPASLFASLRNNTCHEHPAFKTSLSRASGEHSQTSHAQDIIGQADHGRGRELHLAARHKALFAGFDLLLRGNKTTVTLGQLMLTKLKAQMYAREKSKASALCRQQAAPAV